MRSCVESGGRVLIQLAVVLGLVATLVFASPTGTPAALAQPGCSSNATVSTQAELQAAIDCFNSSTTSFSDWVITLQNDIVLEFPEPTGIPFFKYLQFTINQQNADLSLTIDGNGYGVTVPEPLVSLATDTPEYVMFLIDETNAASVEVLDMALEGRVQDAAEFEQALVVNDSPALLSVRHSNFANAHFAVLSQGPVSVEGSIFEPFDASYDAAGGWQLGLFGSSDIFIDSSTFRGQPGLTGQELEEAGNGVITFGQGDEFIITNSTFIDSRVFLSSEIVGTIDNSTIDGVLFSSSLQLTVSSSIVASCGQPDREAVDPIDGGNNAGGCFDTPVDFEPAADLGCQTPTPNGCPLTLAPVTGSAALGAGDCTGVATDQRGIARTPAGPGCDAGAYESELAISCAGTSTSAATNAELQEAISCFNQATVPGDYTIILQNDIALEFPETTGIAFNEYVMFSINQQGNGFSLTIDGNGQHGMTIPAPTVALDPAAFPTFSLFAIDADNAASVEFQEVVLSGLGEYVAQLEQTLVANNSPAPLSITHSTLMDAHIAVGSYATATGADVAVAVEGSTFEPFDPSVDIGSRFQAGVIGHGDISIRNSTFRGQPLLLEPDLMRAGNGVVSLSNDDDTEVTITNSTFINSAFNMAVRGVATVQNSTIDGLLATNPPTTVTSSIVESCVNSDPPAVGEPLIVDGGNNLGDCFDTPVDFEPSADLGCQIATPTGCPLVLAPVAGSVALGAGDCTGVATDQRGAARTPAGPGCDAGALEADVALVGDVTANGIVDNADVQAILEWLAGDDEPTNLLAGDVNIDATVNLLDALELAQLIAAG